MRGVGKKQGVSPRGKKEEKNSKTRYTSDKLWRRHIQGERGGELWQGVKRGRWGKRITQPKESPTNF